jgi:hypothetical protein
LKCMLFAFVGKRVYNRKDTMKTQMMYSGLIT